MLILHFADSHLDRPFVGLPATTAEARRRGLRAAVERALAVATEQEADLVTIGGDIWEDEHVRPDTRAWLADVLARSGVPVLIAAGNHDPLLPGGNYDRTRWPANVHVFPPGTLTERRIDDVSIWGVSWGPEPLALAEMLRRFRVPDDGRRHLLLVHGTADDHAFADEHGPGVFTSGAVRSSGFEVCLAGHIHRGGHRDAVIYPGSLEPLNRKETGAHTVVLIDGADVTLLSVNTWRYEDCDIDCEGAMSSADIGRAVTDGLPSESSSDLFLTVTLRGTIDPGCEVDLATLKEKHASAFGSLEIVDATAHPHDLDALAEQPTALGRFVVGMRDQIDTAHDERDRQVAELALKLGVAAMHRDEVLPRVD